MRRYSFSLGLAFVDILLVIAAYVLALYLKPDSSLDALLHYRVPFLLILVFWILFSFILGKYHWGRIRDKQHLFRNILFNAFLVPAVFSVVIMFFPEMNTSRFILFGTSLLAFVFEIVFFGIFYSVVRSKNLSVVTDYLRQSKRQAEQIFQVESPEEIRRKSEKIEEFVREECGENVLYLFQQHVDIFNLQTLMISTTTKFNIQKQADNFFNAIVNLQKINDIRYVNKFFEEVNLKLPVGGLFLGCAETKELRKKRLLEKFPPVLNWIYYIFDYIFKRLFPKFRLTKWLYFSITSGRNRVISRAEVLGRLCSCGFEVVEEKVIDRSFFFVVRKIREPFYDMDPTYGAFVKLRRVGKNGKFFNVYKFRTMHPFSEYLQEYVYHLNRLDEGGKMKDDFRVTSLGSIMRKLWIDELPMLINVIKGDMKIVGVRPLSRQYFDLYTDETKKIRTQVKPGLIPPFYADIPKNIDEIQASEIRYVKEYLKNPLLTDIKYFFKAFINIVFKGARSA